MAEHNLRDRLLDAAAIIEHAIVPRAFTPATYQDAVDAMREAAAALRILAAFARTAPGRLPSIVQNVVDLVAWENPDVVLRPWLTDATGRELPQTQPQT